MSTRLEHDSMGPMAVPAAALYGAQTARAVANFPVSGQRLPPAVIRALAMIKEHAARVNLELGLLDRETAMAIMEAAEEAVRGELDAHFVLDVFQTGSGTSSNMNVNEVIANRACQMLGQPIGGHAVHPNDHVNLCQSSNDAFPSAIHLAAAVALHEQLLPALRTLQQALATQAAATGEIVTIGRTHLQDAVPIRLGQVFAGYARQVELASARLETGRDGLLELPLGGTAVGTGLNAHPAFAAKVIAGLAAVTGLPFREASDHFEAQGARDATVAASGALKGCAVTLYKIANDIRWLGSGPRCGLGQLRLPEVQPGSSIMPGKVNPVMAESLIQVCAQVIGNDAAITLGGLAGSFELNTMQPLIAHNLLQSIELLANASRLFVDRCVQGLAADRGRCEELIEQSLAMVTALAPVLGYDRAAAIAKEAAASGRTVRAVALESSGLSAAELEHLLDPRPMTGPGLPGKTR